MAEEIPAALTKDVGVGKFKFPIWGWALIAVAGYEIAKRAKGSGLFGGGASSTTDTTTATPADTASLLTAGLGANGAMPVYDGSGNPVGQGGFNSGTASSITDNDAWRIAAENYLTSSGYNALAASQAVSDYLNGNALSPVEQMMIEAALRALGPTPTPVVQGPVITFGPNPPQGTPPAAHQPTPTPKPAPKPKPPTTTPTTPKPAPPIQQTTPLFKATLKAQHATNERFVAFVNTQDGHGTWWLTNLGGIYSAGAAPYLGGPLGNGVQQTNWLRLTSLYPNKGYKATTADGFSLSFTTS